MNYKNDGLLGPKKMVWVRNKLAEGIEEERGKCLAEKVDGGEEA